MAWGAYYLRDSLFGELPPPQRRPKPVRDKISVLKKVDDYFKENGGVMVRHATRNTVLCRFGNKLTVSYNVDDCTLGIGEIERPKDVDFYASDILAYVTHKIAAYLKQDTLEIRSIHGGAIVNPGTRVLASLPGAQFLSGRMGELSVLAALQTPLGKMTDHFLDEHYPNLAMKNVKVERGPRDNAPNAVIELGAK
jgi:hypothetical protein